MTVEIYLRGNEVAANEWFDGDLVNPVTGWPDHDSGAKPLGGVACGWLVEVLDSGVDIAAGDVNRL